MSDLQFPCPQLADALAAGDQQAFAAALQTGDVALPTVPPPGSGRLLLVRTTDDQLAVPAFTSSDTLRRFDAEASFGVVHGRDLHEIAQRERADVVLFDAAGPFPVQLGTRLLRGMADGLVDQQGATTLQSPFEVGADPDLVRLLESPAVELGLPPRTEILALRRSTPGGTVRTVLVQDDEVAARLAASLSRVLPAGAVADVAVADETTWQQQASALPEARAHIP